MKSLPNPFKAEEAAARAELDQKFRASLLRYFGRRLRDHAQAEDLVQQVFERLLHRGNVASVEYLSGYVFQIASSVFTDHIRRQRTRFSEHHEPFDHEVHGGVDFSAEHVVSERERLARATALLLTLPERTRVIFVLRRLEGMKYQDIAARLNLSLSAVEKHMQRAVAHLTAHRDFEL